MPIHYPTHPPIPPHTWQCPLGQVWENPYRVRYASNLDDGPDHGMPLGGFGAGAIGRSPQGTFNLWHLDGGEHLFKPLPGCQFSVYEETEGGQRQAYALSTVPPEDGTLESWDWYPAETEAGESTGTYHALYPRSWSVYEQVFNCYLTCEQFSPIIPDNYQETSYPLAIFEWTAHNPTDEPITLSILLTWENIAGWFTNTLKSPEVRVRDDGSPVYDYESRWGNSQGNVNRWLEDFSRLGCLLNSGTMGQEAIAEGEGQFALATVTNPAVKVFYHSRWNPAGDGSEIWRSFAEDGSLENWEDETPAAAGERIGAAIAVRFTVRPGKTRKIPFILAWDFPITEFAAGITAYRRYTDFFGRNGQNSWSMIRTALKHSDMWKEAIVDWQTPILEDESLPGWFKMALFNELYDLSSGGSLWTTANQDEPKGHFGVLESFDYRWYESLDVRLYGSFALLKLWPLLEKSVIRSFARAIPTGDETPRVIGYNGAAAIRKAVGATPHDLGAANEHPWVQTNYTSYQDCNLWKDLPCDFVLQVYRDFLFTGAQDIEFLQDCWQGVVQAIAYLKTFDKDGDSIPENGGAPDQTFDDWRLQGISAYCGGLWLAALEAAIAIGECLETAVKPWNTSNSHQNIPEPAQVLPEYRAWLQEAKPRYHNTLWTGRYYRLDSESGSEVVMADQLCGQFYAQLLGLEDIVPRNCADLALKTVYESCFVQFNQGLETPIGAANGVMLDGSPEDPQATHPLEVWTGINFGIGAFLVLMGLKTEALMMTEAVVRQIYEGGLQFRTPEAITAARTFRAGHYLRAMAIWAMYEVWCRDDSLRGR
ncbi:MAG: non-lysosomal glucosylceramidase Gba2 [Phormidium sp. OSCR]|nr:MAG: non-lysosomal glucosylceramidase Gba2 [Phormidium sp. OSCR]